MNFENELQKFRAGMNAHAADCAERAAHYDRIFTRLGYWNVAASSIGISVVAMGGWAGLLCGVPPACLALWNALECQRQARASRERWLNLRQSILDDADATVRAAEALHREGEDWK